MKKILIFAAILLCSIYLAFTVKNTIAQQADTRGKQCIAQGDYHGAIREFSTAYSLRPEHLDTLMNRAQAYEALGMNKEALRDYENAVKLAMTLQGNTRDPRLAPIYLHRGVAYEHRKAYAKAAADYTRILTLAPQTTEASLKLAWLLATCPDAKVRNGARAVDLAHRVCEQSKGQDARALDVLAAAYAEHGAFTEAQNSEKAALLHGATGIARTEYWRRAQLYAQKKAYRQP